MLRNINSMANSLYIHIPFCRRRCSYCDFYSTIYDPGIAASYVESILKQCNSLEGSFNTVYIGGGTPTVLDRELFGRLLKGLGRFLGDGYEFTVEANPESLDAEKTALLLDSGVNRLSIGAQSFSEEKLKRLGRIHGPGRAEECVRLAVKKGFKNISTDLIFGVWGEGIEAWRRDVAEAVKLPVTHISCYSLSYENGTPLFQAAANRSVKPLEDETVAAMYELAIDGLSVRGFKQYEVSNFAKDGFQCRHNLCYWDNDPYIGLGASAVSYIGGERIKNISDVKEYVRRIEDGRPVAESSEKLSPVKRARETAAIKIRTREGIDFKWFKDKTGFDFLRLEGKAMEKLLDEDLIKYRKDNNTPSGICLKRKGFLFCDTVSSSLL